MAEPIRLRPLSISELMDETVALYRRRFLVFVGLALILTLPSLAVAILSGSYRSLDLYLAPFQNGGGAGGVAPSQFNGALLALSYVISFVVSPLAGYSGTAVAPAIVAAAIDVAHGREVGVGQALGAALRRYWALLVVMTVFVLGALLACLIVGIWLLVAWAVVVPVLLEERSGIGQALSRSWQLLQGNWWRTFCIVLFTAGLGLAVELGLFAVVGATIALVPAIPVDARSGLLLSMGTIAGVFAKPLMPIALTLLYYDLRVRHEALDLDQLAATVPATTALAGG